VRLVLPTQARSSSAPLLALVQPGCSAGEYLSLWRVHMWECGGAEEEAEGGEGRSWAEELCLPGAVVRLLRECGWEVVGQKAFSAIQPSLCGLEDHKKLVYLLRAMQEAAGGV
jgi:hypothetical protein